MNPRALLIPLTLLSVLAMVGCGGGGGGGSESQNTSMTLDRSAVEVSVLQHGAEVPTATVVATLWEIPESGIYLYAEGSENGLSNADLIDSGPQTVDISLAFRPARDLEPGTYDDSVTITACYDEACRRHVAGSPKTFTTRYTVTPIEVTDPADTTISGRKYFIHATDIAWDASSSRILIATQSAAEKYPNSVVALDPLTHTQTLLKAFNQPIGDLALSENGDYLYVEMKGDRQVYRFLMPSMQFDNLLTRSNSNSSATELAVQPGAPLTLAYTDQQDEYSSTNSLQLTVTDDTQPRGLPIFASSSNSIAGSICWNGPAELWGVGNGFYRYDVDENGVHPSLFKETLGRDFVRILCGLGLPHTTTGVVFDPLTGEVLYDHGAQPGYVTVGAAVDPSTNRFFLITNIYSAQRLIAIDAANGHQIGSVELRNLSPEPYALRTIRWGNDGLATLLPIGELVVLRGSFISGQTP